MAAIKVNGKTIRPADLCIGDCDHECLIEFWAMHEIEGLCEDDATEERLLNLVYTFGGAPECKLITFSAFLDGEHRTITLEKI